MELFHVQGDMIAASTPIDNLRRLGGVREGTMCYGDDARWECFAL